MIDVRTFRPVDHAVLRELGREGTRWHHRPALILALQQEYGRSAVVSSLAEHVRSDRVLRRGSSFEGAYSITSLGRMALDELDRARAA